MDSLRQIGEAAAKASSVIRRDGTPQEVILIFRSPDEAPRLARLVTQIMLSEAATGAAPESGRRGHE